MLQSRIQKRLEGKPNALYLTSLEETAMLSHGISYKRKGAAAALERRRMNAGTIHETALAAALVHEAQLLDAPRKERKFAVNDILQLLFTASGWPGLTGEAVQAQMKRMKLADFSEHIQIGGSGSHKRMGSIAVVALHKIKTRDPNERRDAEGTLETFTTFALMHPTFGKEWSPQRFFDAVLEGLPPESVNYLLKEIAQKHPEKFRALQSHMASVVADAGEHPQSLEKFIPTLHGKSPYLQSLMTREWLRREFVERCQTMDDMQRFDALQKEARRIHARPEILMDMKNRQRANMIAHLTTYAPDTLIAALHCIELTRKQMRRLHEHLELDEVDFVTRVKNTNPTAFLGTAPRTDIPYTLPKNASLAERTASIDPFMLVERRKHIAIDLPYFETAYTRVRRAEGVMGRVVRSQFRKDFPALRKGADRNPLEIDSTESTREATRDALLRKLHTQHLGIALLQAESKKLMSNALICGDDTFRDVIDLLRSVELKPRLAEQRGRELWYEQAMHMLDVKENSVTEHMLFELITQHAVRYDFTEEQVVACKEIAKKAVQQSQAVHRIRQKHPDAAELYRFLFGRKPAGRIQVVQTPLCLYFRCEEFDDYFYLFKNCKSLDSATEQQTKRAKRSGGCARPEGLRHSAKLGIAIAVERNETKLPFTDSSINWIFAHENMHIYQTLFHRRETALTEKPPRPGYKAEPEDTIDALYRSLRLLREMNADVLAKEEILCYFATGVWDMHRIKDNLFERGPNPLYDYKKEIQKVVRGSIGKLVRRGLKRVLPDILETEYEAHVDNALAALQTLIENNYDTSTILGLLTPIPLAHWKKFVERFLRGRSLRVASAASPSHPSKSSPGYQSDKHVQLK